MPSHKEHKFINEVLASGSQHSVVLASGSRPSVVEHKWCSVCLIYQPLTAFGPAKSSKDGLRNMCKESRKIKSKPKVSKFKTIKDIEYKYCENHKDWHIVEEFGVDNRQLGKTHNGYTPSCKKSRYTPVLVNKRTSVHTVVDGLDGKVCTDCNIWKHFKDNNFRNRDNYKDGSKCYSNNCRDCINKKTREKYEPVTEKPKITKVKKKEARSIHIVVDNEEGKVCTAQRRNPEYPVELEKFLKDLKVQSP